MSMLLWAWSISEYFLFIIFMYSTTLIDVNKEWVLTAKGYKLPGPSNNSYQNGHILTTFLYGVKTICLFTWLWLMSAGMSQSHHFSDDDSQLGFMSESDDVTADRSKNCKVSQSVCFISTFTASHRRGLKSLGNCGGLLEIWLCFPPPRSMLKSGNMTNCSKSNYFCLHCMTALIIKRVRRKTYEN